ncbi:MAG: CBS domain-containing protein [Myxococcales bacterium]|nr:CBS domain-containing protein [Myxococcales bacterium]
MVQPGEPQVSRYMTPCPATIAFDATLEQAAEQMGELGVRHLPVLKGGHAIGVLSESDISQVRSLSPRGLSEVAVIEAMTPVPYAVPPTMALKRVVRMMLEHSYGCALITDDAGDGAVIGVFTQTDALDALADLIEHGRQG